MHSDAEVLAELAARLTGEELPRALQRILRVNVAWRKLHDAELLAAFHSSELPAALTPSHIASLALGGDLASPLDLSLLARYRDRANQPDAFVNDDPAEERELIDAALRGLELAEKHTGKSLAERIKDDPMIWSEPMAVAWPAVQGGEEVLQALLSSEDMRHHLFAIHVVQANFAVEKAAAALAEVGTDRCESLLAHLVEWDEAELAKQLVFSLPSASKASGPGDVGSLLLSAEKLQLRGEPTEAYRSLQAAWDRATRHISTVADRLADFARLEGDPVLAAEAAQRAFEARPTPERRARYALGLLAIGRNHDGLALLPANSGSLEEEIARGYLLVDQGRDEEARMALKEAVHLLTSERIGLAAWRDPLMGALRKLGMMAEALIAAQAWVQFAPWSPQARSAYAVMLDDAGDPEAAVEQARLAHALAPGSPEAKRSLAKSLARTHSPAEALPYMEQLMAGGESQPIEVARTALAAGNLDLAERCCHKSLQADPASLEAQTIDAQCKAARGDREAAAVQLAEIIRRDPQQATARLALAEVQMASADEIAAGETLFAAAQAIPHHAEPKLALARWLRAQHRLSEAAEMARAAANLDPMNPDCLLEYAELALELGQSKQALIAYTQAQARQPANWHARLGLARAMESNGDFDSAFKLAKSLPASASSEGLLHAGRIAIRAAAEADIVEGLAIGTDYLSRALNGPQADPRIILWQARAHEVAGRPVEAMESYQSCLPHFSSQDADSYHMALLGLSRSAVAARNISLALSTLEQARERFPNSLEALTLLSSAYLEAHLPERAIEVAEEAILLNRNHSDGYLALVRAEAASGDLAAALEACARLSNIDPNETQAWLEVAEIALCSDDSAIARKALAETLWRGRRRPAALGAAAAILEQLHEIRCASYALRIACRHQPDDASLHRKLGELSDRTGDVRTAHRAWSRAVELEPDHATSLEGAANAHWSLGHHAEALEMWQRALELQPDDPVIQRRLARGRMESGDIQAGLNLYASAIENDPYDGALAVEAGEAALRHGAFAEAVQILEAAVELDSQNAEAWGALGECYALTARWAEAELALSQASASLSARPQVPSLRALAALEREDMAGAAEWLDQASRLEPHDAHDALWLSRAAMRLGDWALAEGALNTWLNGAQEVEIQAELVSLKIRVAEARWLYRAAGAQRAAPAAAFASADVYRSIQKMLKRAPLANHPAAEVLWLRAAVAFDDPEVEPWSALEAQASHHSDGFAALSLASARLRTGHPEAAIEALMIAPPPPYIAKWDHLIRALCYCEMKENVAALAELEMAGQDPSISPLAGAMAATLLLENHDYHGAIESLNRALASWPGEAQWHHRLADIYIQQKALDTALPHLQQAVELDPAGAEHRLTLARSLQACGHTDEAFHVFEDALEHSEASAEDFVSAAESAMQTERLERAFEWFERACTLSPSDAKCLIGAARAASALGENRLADERMEAALRLAPRDPAVYIGQSEVLASAGDPEGALAALDRAAAWGSQDADLHYARSKALSRLGRKKEALDELRTALERAPEQAGLWHELASASETAGDMDMAAEAASKAVRYAPMNASYRLDLARISRLAGNLDRALDELNRASDLDPSDPDIALEQGMVHEDRREYPSALQAYERAIELDDSCTKAFYRSGVVLRTLKAYREAGRMLKRAAELAPIDRQVLHQLAAVRALELVHGGTIRQGAIA